MDPKIIQQHSERVAKGEKSRILWECFMDVLGVDYQTTAKEVFEKMKEVQAKYEESVNFFGEIMKRAHDEAPKKTRKKKDIAEPENTEAEGVSLSHK